MGPIASWWSSGLPHLVGRAARRLGEDADRLASAHFAEVNYVHSRVNTVHMSGPHPRRPVTPAPPTTATARRSPWLCSPPPRATRTAAAPKLTLPTGGGRGAGRLYRPSGSGFSSAACVNVCDRAGAAAFHRPTGSCRITPSPSRHSPPSRRARRPPALAHPRRNASLDLP